jgi:cephalosporin hydroxylase
LSDCDADAVRWSDDRVVVGDTTYVLMDGTPDPDELHLYKPRIMLECFELVIAEFLGANILEIGILYGGSTAYFAQRCRPRRLVALDRSEDRVERLDRFLEAQGLHDRVALHYGVDQSDRDRLGSIATQEFEGEEIDLVIDDASHRYGPTVASFETLFPLLRPGGLYLIEDWTADDWLSLSFVNILEHVDPTPRAICEQWLAAVLAEPDTLVAQVFERWVLRTLTDPSEPHHEAVERWCAGLRRPGASADAKLIDERVRARVALGPAELAGPTLGTLGLQLLLAVKGLCGSVASVSVNPWWIAVRRGGPIDPTTFTVESVGRDRLDMVTNFAASARAADGAARVSPAP